MSDTHAFWIDAAYDRASASDETSRYGAYVRDRAGSGTFDVDWLDDPTDQAAAFAGAAWRVATPPVMVPGYVRCHPRLLGSRVQRSTWDGTLVGVVEVATPWPAALDRSRTWRRGVYWRDWQIDHADRYAGPTEEQATKAPYALASVSLTFPLPAADLPRPPYHDVEDAARHAIAALVAGMRRVVDPVIATLEG